ncbi:hypothetical protein NC99_32690 [Sunxiuqinia dokdonensis]|uniref:Uncharacterized protein n=1 Tax=Sunxiuqinia dokdonensis TaxID=1409788 RepID=A0A0L8V5Z3_9BACT|nr:hypothetical protein NC99_32690 [Sunxiuqinia dokdonensis]
MGTDEGERANGSWGLVIGYWGLVIGDYIFATGQADFG